MIKWQHVDTYFPLPQTKVKSNPNWQFSIWLASKAASFDPLVSYSWELVWHTPPPLKKIGAQFCCCRTDTNHIVHSRFEFKVRDSELLPTAKIQDGHCIEINNQKHLSNKQAFLSFTRQKLADFLFIIKEVLILKVSFLTCQCVKLNPNFKILLSYWSPNIWMDFYVTKIRLLNLALL